MNKKVLSLASLLLLSSSVYAVDGTISIEGEITDVSCTVTLNDATAGASGTVTLPKISRVTLTNGKFAGRTPFEIKISNCTSPTLANMSIYFEPDFTTDFTHGMLFAYDDNGLTTKTNTNLRFELLNKEFNKVDLTKGSGTQNSLTEPVTGADGSKTAKMRFFLQYRNVATTGDVNAAKAYSKLLYTVIYL